MLRSLRHRFKKQQRRSKTGCWLWKGPLNKYGYGAIKFAGKMIRANRAAWLIFRGKIPLGKWVLHKCDVRHCVNPDHLYIGTAKDNAMDAVNRGRNIGRPVTNRFKVPKKQWNKWSNHAKRVFNQMMLELRPKMQWVFLHPKAKPLAKEHWQTVRWNASWAAACAADGERLPTKYVTVK